MSKDKTLWKEMQNQIKENSTTVKKGTIQDAILVTSDSVHRKKGEPNIFDSHILTVGSWDDHLDPEKKTDDELKSALIEERKHSLTRRSKDTTWAKNNSKSYSIYMRPIVFIWRNLRITRERSEGREAIFLYGQNFPSMSLLMQQLLRKVEPRQCPYALNPSFSTYCHGQEG